MVNLALNKVQPAAVLHIPVHFGSYARQEAAKPFLKFMGGEDLYSGPQVPGGTGPGPPHSRQSNHINGTDPNAASLTSAEPRIQKGILLCLCTRSKINGNNKT